MSKHRIALAVGLFFLSPLIAEFLLGNLPIKLLPVIIVLAPLYGGGTLLIRELVRRTGRGWPTIILLALVYGIVEEAFTTQSLFNPNYLKLNMHLLDPAYLPALGIGVWWTLFVLTLHTAWSVSTSIALMEALSPDDANTPWLGRTGFIVTTVLFALGVAATTLIGFKQDHYLASPMQLLSAALACVILTWIAFRIPGWSATQAAWIPNPWLCGVFTLAAGSLFLLVPKNWAWGAVAAILALESIVVGSVLLWSRSYRWGLRHKVALASGAALAYAWHAFIENPAAGHLDSSVRVGNAIFALAALGLISVAAQRVHRMEARQARRH
jgi:hypothetical protein